jgi:hypothetical protein
VTDPSLQRAAAAAAIAAAVVGLLYSISFVVVSRLNPASGALLSALFLLLGGLFGVVAFLGVYDRRREDRPAFSMLFVVLGAAGGLGAAVHGGYDLANALHPPASVPGDVPNPVDPRGFLTFGVTGLALLLLGALVQEGPGRLGYLAGGLLILVYLARLIVLAPTSPLVLVPAALAGFVVNPAFYLWLGLWLRRSHHA